MDIVRLPLRALGLCRALGHSPRTPVLPAENPAQNSSAASRILPTLTAGKSTQDENIQALLGVVL